MVRTIWAALAVAMVVFSVIGALVTPVGLMIALSLLGLAIGATVRKGLLPRGIVAHPLVVGDAPDSWTGTVAAVGFILLCLAIAGLITVAGPAATAELLGCGVAAAAIAVWRFRSAPDAPERAEAPPAPVPPIPPVAVPSVDALPIDELCLAWRRSYLQLQRAADQSTREQLIRARRTYLDELERRDRPGFTRWLESGARPGGDPRRYLSAG